MKKHNLIVGLLLILLLSVCLLTVTACNEAPGVVPGEQGPQGVQGEQGIQGPQGEKGDDGKDADINNLAVITFNSDTWLLYPHEEMVAVDPILTEKGKTVDLPEISYYGYRFEGWYYGDGVFAEKYTNETVIEKSVELTARWSSIPVFDRWDFSSGYADGSNDYFSYDFYADYYNGSYLHLTHNGKKYYMDEAIDAGLISNYDIYNREGYINFEVPGDYIIIVEFETDGMIPMFSRRETMEVSITVKPHQTELPMYIDSLAFSSGDEMHRNIYDGDVIKYVEGEVPSTQFYAYIYAPYGTKYTYSVNGGESIVIDSPDISYNGGDMWYVYFGLESLNTAVTTFTVTATEYSGNSVSASFTIEVIPSSEEQTVITYNHHTPLILQTSADCFMQTVQFHTTTGVASDSYVISSVVVDENGNEITNADIIHTASGYGNMRRIETITNACDLAEGKYTITTTVMSDATETAVKVIEDVVSEFYVISGWTRLDDNYTMLVGKENVMEYKLNHEVTALAVNGVAVAIGGGEVDIPCSCGILKASLRIDGGVTYLTIKHTPDSAYDYYMEEREEVLFEVVCTVYGAEYLHSVMRSDTAYEEAIKLQPLSELSAIKWLIQNYLMDDLDKNATLKTIHDLVNQDLFALSMDELYETYQAVMDLQRDNVEYEQFIGEALTPEGKTLVELQTELRERVFAESLYDDLIIEFMAGSSGGIVGGPMVVSILFDDLTDLPEDAVSFFAPMLHQAAAYFLAEEGVFFAESMFFSFQSNSSNSIPEEFQGLLEEFVDARTAWITAVDAGEEAVALRKAYVLISNELFKAEIEYVIKQYSGGIIRVI